MQKHLLQFMNLVPKNKLSRFVGMLTRSPLPQSMHQGAIRLFVRSLGVCVEEAERPISDYPTFSDFFVRRLQPGARPIDSDPFTLTSPCDGTFGAAGKIERGMLIQAKGRKYSLDDFLGDSKWSKQYDGGLFLTIYLSPVDYHRVHFPVDGEVVESRHVPGTLWPVSPLAVNQVEDLFAVNERLITHVKAFSGFVGVVMVGATCVGRMRRLYEDGATNSGVDLGKRSYEPGISVKKGGELGVFEMGSTVVLLLSPEIGCSLEPTACTAQEGSSVSSDRTRSRVLMGQVIARTSAS